MNDRGLASARTWRNVNQTCRSRGWRKSRRWSLDGIWVAGHSLTKRHTHTTSRGSGTQCGDITHRAVTHSSFRRRPQHAPPRPEETEAQSLDFVPTTFRDERDLARSCAIDLLCEHGVAWWRRAVSIKNTQDRINSSALAGSVTATSTPPGYSSPMLQVPANSNINSC